jgi:hypothetical protein
MNLRGKSGSLAKDSRVIQSCARVFRTHEHHTAATDFFAWTRQLQPGHVDSGRGRNQDPDWPTLRHSDCPDLAKILKSTPYSEFI